MGLEAKSHLAAQLDARALLLAVLVAVLHHVHLRTHNMEIRASRVQPRSTVALANPSEHRHANRSVIAMHCTSTAHVKLLAYGSWASCTHSVAGVVHGAIQSEETAIRA